MREKTDRNEELVRMHGERPELSFTQLGRRFGISKQRAHKIFQDNPTTIPQTTQNQREGGLRARLKGFFMGLFKRR